MNRQELRLRLDLSLGGSRVEPHGLGVRQHGRERRVGNPVPVRVDELRVADGAIREVQPHRE